MASNDAIRAFPRKILLLLVCLLVAVAFAVLAPSTAQAWKVYDISVSGKQITGLNRDDVFGDGTVRYEEDEEDGLVHGVLFLDNAKIKVADIDDTDAAGIYIGKSIDRLDIVLSGKNTITMPSGNLNNGYINGIMSYAGNIDLASLCFYGDVGDSLSINLSSDEKVWGIYNFKYGVDINYIDLSMTLSSGSGYVDGIQAKDTVSIYEATVDMNITGETFADGIECNGDLLLSDSKVTVKANPKKTCTGSIYGVYADRDVFIDGDSSLTIDNGASDAINYGIKASCIDLYDDSIIRVHAGKSQNSNSIGFYSTKDSGEDENLFMYNDSAAEFSGYTQAVSDSVIVSDSVKADGAIVNASKPTLEGASAWNKTTPLKNYKYIHFPGPIDIAEAVISAIAKQAYTGAAITPAITVKLGNTVVGTAYYTVKYTNNVKAGTATVTVTGKGIFKGTQQTTFTIYRKPCNVKNLWASKHEVGYVTFKWTKESAFQPTGWKVKYRTKKISGGSWSGWTEKSFGKDIYQFKCPVKANYVVEIHAKEAKDTTYSQGIITTPAGGKYQAMKTVYVKNVATGKRVDSITIKKGKTVKLKPDYEYPVANYKKRPRLYPNAALWDLTGQGKTIVSISKPNGSAYSGGMIDGAATIKGLKVGTTDLICRAPNGRTKVIKVTVTN